MDGAAVSDADGAAGDGGPEGPGPGLRTVGLYLVDRAYGGPEEGGWWYEVGTLVQDPEEYARLGALPTAFADEDAAASFADSLRDALAAMNEGRPDIGHSNSKGRYELVAFEGASLPAHYPPTRPRYE